MLIKGSLKKGILLALIVLLNFACSTSRVATKQDTQIPKSAPPEFEVVLWTDHRDNTYQIGENIYFFFVASKDCYVTFFDISSNGKVKMILPNRYQKDNQAKAGFVYRIPSESTKFRFKAREPDGQNTVLAIATIDEIPLYDQKDSRPSHESVKEVDIEEIARKLRPIDPAKWARYRLTINVVRNHKTRDH